MIKVVVVAISVILAYYIDFDYVITCCGIKILPEHVKDSPATAQASSAWCDVTNGTRHCTFKNLCYEPKEKIFLFVLKEQSVLLGLTSKEDLKTIQLSSVMNHNLFSMKIAIIGSENNALESEELISEPIFLLWRFKWDNIMHILHDDILPLYLTYLNICKDVNACVSKYTLGFADGGVNGPYEELYTLFSKQEPIFLHKHKKLVCFSEIHAGILSTTIWFQYGFGKPQGPANNISPFAILQGFKDYIFQRLYISSENISSTDTVLLFNRKLNRRILNYSNFSSKICHVVQQAYPSSHPQVVSFDLASHNLSFILKLVQKSKIVVGMHGSAMILCMFLKPGSVVLELFPYAIQPENVSFLKAFSNMKGAGIIYRSWVNKNESLTVPHPEAPPLLGGIHHLSLAEQEIIHNTKVVPAVECCHNPMYLFRMFQDTIIGSDFDSIFLEALLEQKTYSEDVVKTTFINHLFKTWYFPAPVKNVSCAIQKNILSLSWEPPINAATFLMYDVAVLMKNGSSFMKRTERCKLNVDIVNYNQFFLHSAEVWVKAIAPEGESVDVYAKCQNVPIVPLV